ncbi:hypothetical protein ACTTAL_03470 [Rhodobacter capsulatus]|uniref:hypothetical protein n=1 Tax=Rhodobacter capsulatus TaxID=1061 RepID=UPI0003D3ACBC|nr:hypothetical protein [Rhodobacter capsulatus]ETD89833.1 hypothetical protein U713_07430 [Rhodobacter capsulatus YW2]
MTVQNRSIGDLITVRRASANTAVTAGGTGDNTEVTGVIIDRAAIGFPKSCVVAIPFTATLAAAATMTLAWSLEDGNDAGLSDAAVLTSASAAVVATGPTDGGTVTGTFEANVNLAGAGRYVRIKFTPNLSAANTDTAALSAVVVFGGAERLPA